MDLSRIYPLLSQNAKNQIGKIILSEFGFLADQLGYKAHFQEKTANEITQPQQTYTGNPPLTPQKVAPKEKKRKYRERLTFPVKLHGYNFDTLESLLKRYGVTEYWFKYRKNAKKMDLEDIFPNPPQSLSNEQKKTLIKRVDSNGVSHLKLG